MFLAKFEEYSRKERNGANGQSAQLGLRYSLKGTINTLYKSFTVPRHPKLNEHTEQQIFTYIVSFLDFHKKKDETLTIYEIQIISHLSPCTDCAKKLAELPEALSKYHTHDSSQATYSIGSHGIFHRPAATLPEVNTELATSIKTMTSAKWKIEAVDEIPSLMLKPADMNSLDYFMLTTKDKPELRKKIAGINWDFRKAVAAELKLKEAAAASSASSQPAAAANSLMNPSPAVSNPK
ncbi:Hypothetical protein PSEBR_m1207 [Pseudomonas brassicacearum subsp. brassicacearum NFM421]|uniref:Uncharacterized protein n=1 Tax=Pseudomonas brassicacearum (strain NFM421) TaxID=994484 RepID=F2KJK4_PSEBN|nr:hypothetical protein [Pseudomonas brassicacearum]AEA70230.1 Hypothetical protein PSEBR_m1207 [Pseudomonas brassicacearum subsp. brassicacearum NFM421]